MLKISGKKLAYLIIIVVCVTALTVSMTGCDLLEEKTEDLNKYEVKVQVDPEGAGKIQGEGVYDEKSNVVVEAEAKENSSFIGWEKDNEKVSSKEEYEFEITEDKLLKAIFYAEKKPAEVDDWQIEEDIVNIDDLEHLAVKENWKDSGKDGNLASVGDNFLAVTNRDEQKINLIAKDSLEVVDQIEDIDGKHYMQVDFLGKDYLLYRNIGNKKPCIYHISHEGKEKAEEIDIYESGLNVYDEENKRLSQMALNIDRFIRTDFSIAGDYVFIYPDYSFTLEHEKPPRLNEPVLKVFQFQDDELEKIEDDLLEESLLTVDIAKYQDDTALLSTACHGLIEVDLTDFSMEKLNFGGNYNLAEDNRPQTGRYKDHYVAHSFKGISSERVMLMRSQIPLPKCHSWKKHMVVPDDDDTFTFVGQSTVGPNVGMIDDEDFADTGHYELKGDWIVVVERSQRENEEESKGRGIIALLELNNEKALQGLDADSPDLPKVGKYFDIKVDLKNILSEAEIDQLPHVLAWEIEGNKKISDYHPVHAETGNVVFSRIKGDRIELRQLAGDLQVFGVDDKSKEIYLQSNGKLYRLDYNIIFEKGNRSG